MTLHDEKERVDRGHKARAIIENPIYAEAVQLLRETLVREWLATRLGQQDERERVWALRQMLERLNAYFENTAKTGELTARNLAAEPNKSRFRII